MVAAKGRKGRAFGDRIEEMGVMNVGIKRGRLYSFESWRLNCYGWARRLGFALPASLFLLFIAGVIGTRGDVGD